ncbi:MAG: AMP-dependent synthetase/ligase [Bifidobacteriaceae bacterium]|jgi:long-chain acyl-CoA synthetase|nr:AMP-dependent synthetase/ligase [Bifidobacteriaceae bacterium]
MKVSSTPALRTPDPDESIADLLLERRDRDPAAPIIEVRDGDGWRPVSAHDFVISVEALAKGLVAAGIGHGDRVGVMARTSPEWTQLDYALWFVGAVGVPIYETSSPAQARWIIENSAVAAVVCETAAHAETVSSVYQGRLWVLDDAAIPALVQQGRSVSDAALAARREAVQGDDLAALIYTSGTTGRPKGVELTHLNFTTAARNAAIALDWICHPGSRALLFLPLAHVFARVINVIALHSGTIMGYAPDTKTLIKDFSSFRPTFLLVVPRVLEKVYNAAEASTGGGLKLKLFRWAAKVAIVSSRELDSRGGFTPVRRVQYAIAKQLVFRKLTKMMGGNLVHAVSGGAPLGERLGHFFRGIGLTVYEGYGLTETTAPTAVNLEKVNKIGTVGPPLPGQTVAVGEDGEILAQGFHIFRGYWADPEATAEVLKDGWFHTGDIGSLDQDGYLTITGRRKELIVTASGKNVVPATLEDRLRGHPLVSQVVVVGDQRPFVAALITLDEEMIPGWLANHGKSSLTIEQARIDPDIRVSLERAVARTNQAVSRAESIREFRILGVDFTEENGYLTPSLKVKRSLVLADFAPEIEALYVEAAARRASSDSAK